MQDLNNYRMVAIKDCNSAETYRMILLNKKHTVTEFQTEMNKVKDEHMEEIAQYGDDLEIVLNNIEDGKFDWFDNNIMPIDDEYLEI